MSNLLPGFFISFEGIDGAGKSTHIESFGKLIQSRHPQREVVLTREPGEQYWESNCAHCC